MKKIFITLVAILTLFSLEVVNSFDYTYNGVKFYFNLDEKILSQTGVSQISTASNGITNGTITLSAKFVRSSNGNVSVNEEQIIISCNEGNTNIENYCFENDKVLEALELNIRVQKEIDDETTRAKTEIEELERDRDAKLQNIEIGAENNKRVAEDKKNSDLGKPNLTEAQSLLIEKNYQDKIKIIEATSSIEKNQIQLEYNNKIDLKQEALNNFTETKNTELIGEMRRILALPELSGGEDGGGSNHESTREKIKKYLNSYTVGSYGDLNVPIGQNGGTNSGAASNALGWLENTKDIKVGSNGERSIKDLLIIAARDIKNMLYIVAGVYFLIQTVMLLLAEKSDEAVTNWKKGVLRISMGIVAMQMAYYAVNALYARDIGGTLAVRYFTEDLLNPIIKILETGASFIFIAMAVYAFYRMVTSNGNEEGAKDGKMTIFYGCIGFIIIKLSKEIIYATYGKINCQEYSPLGIFTIRNGSTCIAQSNLSGVTNIIVNIINWVNGFVGIAVIIMILYAGANILFSNGDGEKIKKAKNTIVYIVIGLAILVLSYFILTFFINPEIY